MSAKKLSSYQRLRKENDEMIDDILVLLMHPDSHDAHAVRIKWNKVVEFEKEMLLMKDFRDFDKT